VIVTLEHTEQACVSRLRADTTDQQSGGHCDPLHLEHLLGFDSTGTNVRHSVGCFEDISPVKCKGSPTLNLTMWVTPVVSSA
jgi:hypothetical protein